MFENAAVALFVCLYRGVGIKGCAHKYRLCD